MREELFIIKDFKAFKREAALYYDLGRIKERMEFLKNLKSKNVKFLFPVKSFPHEKILSLAAKHLDGFDISNPGEKRLIEGHLKNGHLVWSSSPYYRNNLADCDFLDINSNSELEKVGEHSSISLRIATDFLGVPSRFGFEPENTRKLLEANPQIRAVHIHLSGQHNCVDNYLQILESLESLLDGLDGQYHVNFGGGFAPLSEADVEKVVIACSEKLAPHTVYFEPGRWIAIAGGFAAGHVLSVARDRILTSLSPTCHLKWMDPKIKIKFLGSAPKEEGSPKKYKICGPTCYEGDVLAELAINESSVNANDLVIIGSISGYAHAWNHSFNGIPKADVVFFE